MAFNSLRNYLRDIRGQIRIHQHGIGKLQRVNDIFLMDLAISSQKFGPAALKRINYCRMYMNVLLLSDITHPNGRRVDLAACDGDRDMLHSTGLGHTVNQTKPNDKAWAEWRQYLNLLCHREKNTLKEPLGAWTAPPQDYTRQWVLLYSTQEDKVYHHTAFDYYVHQKLHHDYDKDTEEFWDDLPPGAVPIEFHETPTTWIQPRILAQQDLCLEHFHHDTLTSKVTSMQRWERELLQEVVFIQDKPNVWEALCNGRCYVASDGSAPNALGSFTWVLSNASGNQLRHCCGPVFGHAISSYRAKAYGMLSFLCFLYNMIHVHQHTRKSPRSLHLVCDNQGLIQMVTTIQGYTTIFPNTTMDADWDCISQIIATLQDLGDHSPTLDHIIGHCPMLELLVKT